MIAKPNWKLITLLAAGLALTLATPTWARGPHHERMREGVSKPRPPRSAHPRGLLGQLVFPCPAACDSAAGSCHDTATDEALTCVTDACAAEVAAAQTACAADRSAAVCRAAVGALAECADACLDAHATASTTCRDTLIDCRAACDSEE